MMDKTGSLRAQVFICTYGIKGMRNVLGRMHKPVEGVEYVICLQMEDGQRDDERWPQIDERDDYRIIRTRTRGIAVNRNIALDNAEAPVAFITDDDVTFLEGGLEQVIADFESHPDADVISFRFMSDQYQKPYPDFEFNYRNMPRFYYVSAMEIAVRPERIRGKLRFNEAFGFHTYFHGGEDDVFSIDVIKSGLNGYFVPHAIIHHPTLSTGSRPDPEYRLIETRGAVTFYRHPHTWPLRMIWRGWNDTGRSKKYRMGRYLVHWLRGVIKAKRLRVFPTPV